MAKHCRQYSTLEAVAIVSRGIALLTVSVLRPPCTRQAYRTQFSRRPTREDYPVKGHPVKGHPVNGHPEKGYPLGGSILRGPPREGHPIKGR